MPARLPGRLQDCDLTDSAIFGSSTELPANEHTSPKQIPAAHLHPDYDLEHEGDSTPPSDASDASSSNAAAGSAHHRHSLHKLIHRRNSTHIKGSRREKVTMVAHSLHSAFKSWFRDTESDGSPVLPSPLSKKYEVLPSVLGEGSFAVVKPVVERATGTKRALKIIAKKPLKGSNEKMLKEEINILGKVVHPNIIKMWDLYETKEGVFIVTDLCRGGELFDRLVEKVHYNELDARHIMKQVFEGVAYLHDHDIIHRDLKPENILLKDKEEPSHIVISDFGLSKFIPHDGLLMTACGSPQYVSPEVLLGKGYSSGVDIWSSGVIAYCLLGGYTPFYGDDQPTLFQQILAMKVEFEPQYWDEISSTAKDFILKCLCPADKRMTAREALEHPWLADLPELHPELCNDVRGACLKSKAQKNLSSFRKVSRAVTAVEAVNYLQRLHTLRKEHSPDAHPEALHSLMRMASNISSHQGVDASHTLSSGAGGGAARSAPEASHSFDLTASTETVTPQNEDAEMGAPESNTGGADSVKPKPKKEDSGMSLDLVIMTAFLPPDPPGILPPKKNEAQDKEAAKDAAAGTAAVAEAAEATTNTSAADRAPSPDSDSTEMPPKKPAAQRNGASKKGASKATSEALNTLLDQYNSTERPSSARIDPAIKARVPEKLTLANSWRYVPFLMNQTYSIGSALASHAFYGPLKKSWGIEMSVFTRLMRDTAEYSQFASVDGLQQFFELASLLPTPKDGLITPVTFRVKKRNLRGLLAEADAAEDGKRELSGEWVVGKHTWRRLQSEWRNGQQKGKERVILYIHGGAYFVMSATTHRPLTIALSKYTECRVFSINYRLAPGTIFPGALHDVVSSWFRLVDDLGIPPSNIVLGADSAGGGLAMALMYYLRDNKYDLPGGAMLFSPWVDLTMSCDSWETNANFDYLPMPKPGDHMNPIYAYLGENIDKYLTHPYVSPLFGDMKGLPPLLIQCGDAELLRDEVTLLAHKASVSGVAVRHELYEDCVHVFQVFLFLDASRKALQSARHFVRTALDKRGERKGRVTDEATGALNKEMREKMEDTKGARVEPRTGKSLEDKEGKRQAQSDEEDDDEPNMGDEQWEFDGDNFASRKASDASKAAHASVQASAKAAFGMDDQDAAKATNPPKDGQGADSASSSGANTPLAVPRFHGSSDMRRSRTQPNSPVSTMRPLSNARDTPTSTSPSSWHQRGLSTSLTQNSLEEARARANAGMRAQHGRAAPPLSPFHAPKQPLAPKIRNRSKSGSNLVLDDLVRSFQSEGKGALQTRVYTPDEA